MDGAGGAGAGRADDAGRANDAGRSNVLAGQIASPSVSPTIGFVTADDSRIEGADGERRKGGRLAGGGVRIAGGGVRAVGDGAGRWTMTRA